MSTATTPRDASTMRATTALRLVALLATGVLTGAVLAIWLLDVELGHSATLYTQYRQATTGPLTQTLPPLGVLALVAAAGAALLERGPGRAFALGATACLLTGLILTVVVLFPMNNEILTWTATIPPADWQTVRDRWQAAHAARCLLSLSAFVVLAAHTRIRPATAGRT